MLKIFQEKKYISLERTRTYLYYMANVTTVDRLEAIVLAYFSHILVIAQLLKLITFSLQ